MLLVGACTDEGASRPDADSPDAGALGLSFDAGAGCETRVADPLIDHACFHASAGPFRNLDVASEDAPDVSRAHTAFRLTLPPSGDGYAGELRYNARLPGGYAFFTSRGARVELANAANAFADHATEICPELPTVTSHALGASSYALRITSGQPKALLVIEYMDEGATEQNYAGRCPLPRIADAGMVSDSGGSAPSDAAAAPDAGFLERDAGGEGGRPCLIDPVLEHTCLHVMFGPHESVTASASERAAPNVNLPHHDYAVALPAGGAGYVSFRPNLTGEHVFYAGAGVQVEVREGASTLVRRFEERVTSCSDLATAHVFELTGAAKYIVVLEYGSGVSATPLLIENVSAVAPRGWSERFEVCE